MIDLRTAGDGEQHDDSTSDRYMHILFYLHTCSLIRFALLHITISFDRYRL